MSKPIDELYLTWLYSQVGDTKIKDSNRTYWKLLRQLYTTEFVWLIPHDDNRIEDGRDLRYEFVDQSKLADVDRGWIRLGCSMLELLIALSRQLAFECEGEPRDWFWHLIRNLELQDYNDAQYSYFQTQIAQRLEQVIWRRYEYNGDGGLFPLKDPHEDQRSVELWYQLNAYVLEMD
jgi:hypothetical protein